MLIAMQSRLVRVGDDFREGLAQRDFARVGLSEENPFRLHRFDHGAADPRFVVPKARRTVGGVIVDVLVVIDVPYAAPKAFFMKSGKGL